MKKAIKFIYYTDALCGWCYGLIPTISEIHQEFKDKIDFDVISGGLFLDERAGRVNEVAPHIKAGAYKQVERVTGVKFGEDFLDNIFSTGSMILDSIFPAIAISIVKQRAPQQVMLFTELLLKAYYYDGISSDDINSYDIYAQQIGFKKDDFSSLMKDPFFEQLARQDFQRFKESSHNVFPSFDIQLNGKSAISISGSINKEEMIQKIKDLLALS